MVVKLGRNLVEKVTLTPELARLFADDIDTLVRGWVAAGGVLDAEAEERLTEAALALQEEKGRL
jgi:hypothetical protein